MRHRPLFAVILLVLAAAAPLVAQQEPPRAVEVEVERGAADGREAASRRGTAEWAALGFAGGIALPILGPQLVRGLAGSVAATPATSTLEDIGQHGSAYTAAYNNAYADRLRQRRRNSALKGGIAGTAVMVAGYVWVLSSL